MRTERIPENIFHAYDVRGSYPRDINARVVEAVARAVGGHLGKGVVVVGHDGRTSSPALAFATLRGLAATRPRHLLVDIGIATTPMCYYLVEALHAAGGIMITASHNPKGMNGMKVMGAHAVALSGLEMARIVREERRTRRRSS
jgi:phosphomannomutase